VSAYIAISRRRLRLTTILTDTTAQLIFARDRNADTHRSQDWPKWSAWVPGRRQWLLTTVIRRQGPQVTLRFDAGYGMASSDDEQKFDETAMIENRSFVSSYRTGLILWA
jgi:hypothetical protein